MFGEDIFKDAKYCVPCNKFYVIDHCPFCTPKKTAASNPEASVSTPIHNATSGSHINKVQPPVSAKEKDLDKSCLNVRIEELSAEIERLRQENKGKKEQIDKGKELELKFNILADKLEHLNRKEKEYRDNASQKHSKDNWFGRNDFKIEKSKNKGFNPSSNNNADDTNTKSLRKRIERLEKTRDKELTAELELLQQKNEEKEHQVLKYMTEASKLNGIVEQQRDELERLRYDIQDRDRVIMQISLTLSSAISQALANRGQEKLQEFTGSRPAPDSNAKPNKRSRKPLYALLGGLNAAIFGYIGYAVIYKKDLVNAIIEFFK